MAYIVCLDCLHRSKEFSMDFVSMHDKIMGDDWKCRSCESRRHSLIQSNKEIDAQKKKGLIINRRSD